MELFQINCWFLVLFFVVVVVFFFLIESVLDSDHCHNSHVVRCQVCVLSCFLNQFCYFAASNNL